MKKLLFTLIIISFGCSNQTRKETTLPKPQLNPNNYNVAFLIIDGVFNTELTAPYDIFHHTIFRENIKAMNVFTVSNQSTPVRTFEGLNILPDYNFLTDSLPNIDILVVPSAEHNLDTDLENEALINFVKQTSKNAIYVTSHCDGAFVLAKSGILNGIESTTFPGDIEAYKKMFPELIIHDSLLFVHDGKFITSAGDAKSFEASLYLCELLYGKKVADELAKGLVIDWELDNIPHIVVSEN
ncbi:MAG: glutamine amidotransferase [Flavobacteriales bacterium]|nr:MAG: glutamine amidotransferase [Flavobacteriales bacterium]